MSRRRLLIVASLAFLASFFVDPYRTNAGWWGRGTVSFMLFGLGWYVLGIRSER